MLPKNYSLPNATDLLQKGKMTRQAPPNVEAPIHERYKKATSKKEREVRCRKASSSN